MTPDEDAYRVEKRWAAPRTGKRGPCGTEFLSVPARNGPASRKLPMAHNRNPTFRGVGVSAAPSLAGVRRTPRAATAAAGGGFPASTSCPNETTTCRQTGMNSDDRDNWTVTARVPDSYQSPKEKGQEGRE